MSDPTTGQAPCHARLPPLLRQAVLAHEARRLEAAETAYRRFLAEQPHHPMALQRLGLLHSQRGEYDTAISLMRESLRLFPEQADVANNLGNALSRAGRLDEAVDGYAQALRIQPRYVDALKNLGLCFLKLNEPADATKCFQRALEVRPDDAVAWLCLGNAHKRRQDFDAAIPCYEKALEIRPDYAEAHHNLGTCLRIRHRAVEALEHYETARGLGLDRAELYYNIGNAFVDSHQLDRAIDAYRAAVARNPGDLSSHRNLNSLLWQLDRREDYLGSFRDVLARHPAADEVRVAYAMALNQQDRYADAERLLRDAGIRLERSPELLSMLAFSLEGQGRWPEALEMHRAAVDLPGAIPNHRISYARALLACRQPDEALRQARQGAARVPFDQRALAYLGLCWRVLGDERDRELNDYQNLVRVYDVPVPKEFSSAAEFNERLGEVLGSLHTSKLHPPEQTLRGGTQTTGELFLRPEPEIGQLVDGLKECIHDYIAGLPQDAEHPLFARRGESFDFAGSWSVRLAPNGYHTMHVHPLGWISSAYYVDVPPEITERDDHGGGIQFGQPDIDLGEHSAPRRRIQPTVGRLVLFPSYMWHGTLPFRAGSSRMTIAFDVVPTT